MSRHPRVTFQWSLPDCRSLRKPSSSSHASAWHEDDVQSPPAPLLSSNLPVFFVPCIHKDLQVTDTLQQLTAQNKSQAKFVTPSAREQALLTFFCLSITAAEADWHASCEICAVSPDVNRRVKKQLAQPVSSFASILPGHRCRYHYHVNVGAWIR